MSDRHMSVNLQDAQLIAGSCEGVRNLMVYNGKYMPAASCKNMRNSEYLMLVFHNKVYVPLTKKVKRGICLNPPKKELILKEILKEIQKMPDPSKYNLGFDDASNVDREWLLDLLATFNEDHRYFDKGRLQAREKGESRQRR